MVTKNNIKFLFKSLVIKIGNKIKIANLIKEIDLKLSEIFLVLKILFKKI